jgi:type II secretory pathway pseudopilin PulG
MQQVARHPNATVRTSRRPPMQTKERGRPARKVGQILTRPPHSFPLPHRGRVTRPACPTDSQRTSGPLVPTLKPKFATEAYSLAEVLIVLALIGIVAGLAITGISGTRQAGRTSVAEGNLNILNGAVTAMNNTGQEIILNPSGDAADEFMVFTNLQSRDINNPVPGSPFLTPNLQFVGTSDTDRFRGQWNGRFFQLISEGSPGTGIDLLEMNATVSP